MKTKLAITETDGIQSISVIKDFVDNSFMHLSLSTGYKHYDKKSIIIKEFSIDTDTLIKFIKQDE